MWKVKRMFFQSLLYSYIWAGLMLELKPELCLQAHAKVTCPASAEGQHYVRSRRSQSSFWRGKAWAWRSPHWFFYPTSWQRFRARCRMATNSPHPQSLSPWFLPVGHPTPVLATGLQQGIRLTLAFGKATCSHTTSPVESQEHYIGK